MKFRKLHIAALVILCVLFLVAGFIMVSRNSQKKIAVLSPSPTPKAAASPTNSPTPTITSTPSPTPTLPVVVPTDSRTKEGTHFTTLPPGSALPSGEECASRVLRNSWEPRPENNEPNHKIPVAGSDYSIIDWGPNSFGQNEKANTLRVRINGNFTGTTDEILQWAACKWGIDEDIVRAQAVQESYWRMSQRSEGDDVVGILQVKMSVHRNTNPAAAISTAFNADYTYGFWRSCYEGYIDWLKAEKPEYGAGDVWGCLGHWGSGTWYNDDANTYINNVKAQLNARRWEQSDF